MANNEFIARKGLLALDDSTISGSLIVENSGSNVFEAVGSVGQLFSINDSMSGSLFAVSDISGLPIFEVFSNDTITAGAYNQNDFTITGSKIGIGTNTPEEKLTIKSGYLLITGSGASGYGIELNRADSSVDDYRLQLLDGGLTVVNKTNSNRKEMTFDGTGKVGIGNPNPTHQLTVEGDISASGDIFCTNLFAENISGDQGTGVDNDWGDSTNYISSSKSVQINGTNVDVPTLDVNSNYNLSNNYTVFRIRDVENSNLFRVIDNPSDGSVFTIADVSGDPFFNIKNDGNVIIDGNIKFGDFGGLSGNGVVLIDSQEDLNNLSSNGISKGEIVKFGNSTVSAGKLYYWTGDNGWVATGQTITAARGALLGIALGTNSDQGMLIRGIAHIADTVSPGNQVYMGSSNGTITTTVPNTSGNTVRSIGHSIEADVIYFNPSPDFIVIS